MIQNLVKFLESSQSLNLAIVSANTHVVNTDHVLDVVSVI